MALQNIRSNTASKRPLASGLSDGQIAVNTNETSPGLFFKGASGAVLKVGPVHVGNSAPNSSPATGGSTGNSVGEQWLDTSNSGYVFKIWDGTAWRSETGEFVDVTGDTMTGNLTISGADLVMQNGEIIAASGAEATPSITFDGDLDTGFYKPAADKLAISTGGTSRVIIDDSGQVGIGTSGPGATLNVKAPGQSGATIAQFDDNGSGVVARFQIETAGGAASDSIRLAGINRTGLQLGSAATTVQHIDLVNNRVGIGTTAPGSLLEVNGGASSGIITVSSTGKSGLDIQKFSANNDAIINLKDNGNLRFYTNSTERMRITPEGLVGIGTTSPDFKLDVVGGGTATIRAKTSDTSGTAVGRLVAGYTGGGGGTANTLEVRSGDGYGYIVNTSNNPLLIGTNSSEKMRITSDGNVGIGTSNPIYRLDISSNSTNTFRISTPSEGGSPLIVAANSNTATPTNQFFVAHNAAEVNIGNARNAALTFHTNDTEKMRITSDGKVGIGTTNPTGNLEVQDTNPSFHLKSGNDTGSAFFTFRSTTNTTRGLIEYKYTDNALCFATNGSGERVRIDSNGRLLVGTSTSVNDVFGASLLQVSSTFGNNLSLARYNNDAFASISYFRKSRGSLGSQGIVSSNDDLGISVFSGSDGSNFIQAATIKASVDGTPGANDMPGRLVFSTTGSGASSPTERMRISSDGSVYINKTNDSASVNGFSYSGGSFLRLVGTSDASLGLHRLSSDGAVQLFRRDNTTVGSISVTTTSTAYNTSSDYRLKENVVPLANAADRLNQLQVHRFNFIADPDTTVDGFLAHEAQAVVPECVTGTKDEVDDEGNPVYQGIDQSKIVPLLTAALQEALAKIETLEQRLTDAGL